jgi:thymidylate synthase
MNNEHLHPEGRPYTKEEFVEKIKNDKEFSDRFGNLGPIYGKQWRSWTNYTGDEINEGTYEMTNEPIDQISELIKQLKDNPDSRRMIVSAWAVHDLPNMVLPPCHYGFQVYTRELSLEERVNLLKNINTSLVPTSKMMQSIIEPLLIKNNIPTRAISLMWNQRSVDTFLGLPFNIASYGLLLEIIAKSVNMVPDELIGNLGDVHLYSNHIEQAKEQIGRKYTPEERTEMLKESMGYENYHNAINELMPFGGGLSEYYDSYKIPRHSREPFPLPTLKHMKTDEFYKSLGEDLSLITHLDNIDVILENYQSHSTIKAPLSN